MKKGKVFVFGIDGATFDIILPAICQGRLNNLRALIQEGSWGRLQSTIHPVTPMAWSSFATGTGAGKHGIFDFSRIVENQVKLSTALDRKMPAIWTYLSKSGRNSIVLNVPFTYPSEKIRGIMIPGFDSPRVDRKIFHPESIYEELAKHFGDYRLDWTFPIGKKFDPEAYLRDVESVVAHRGDTGLYLLSNHPWDFFMTVFTSTDHVQHVFWKNTNGRKIIEQVYEAVDIQLGRFLKVLPSDTTIIVMSDHGAGPINGIVNLDNWLAKEGYLKRRRFDPRTKVLKQCKNYLRKKLSTRFRKMLRSRFSYLKGRLEKVEYTSSIDWHQTRAYSYGMYGNIYINLKGRSPWGIVEPRDYDVICDQIDERLCELVDPKTGDRVVGRVYRKEELYSGPCMEQAPDLVVQWRDYAYYTQRGIDKGEAVFGEDLNVDASEFPHTGTHRIEGVFIAQGPHIRQQHEVQAKIVDLAPTILHLLGEPIPTDLDGRVLTEIFEETFLEATSDEKTSVEEAWVDLKEEVALTDEEESSLRERLKSLGYIDAC